MSSAGGMPSHTASTILTQTVPVSHDLTISGYSASTAEDGYTVGTYIKSAKFVAGGRRWYLRYYPNGCSSDDRYYPNGCSSDDRYYPNGFSSDDSYSYSSDDRCLTFLLYHDRDSGVYEDKVSVSYHIFLLGPDGNPVPGYEKTNNTTYGEPPSYTTGLIGRTALERSGYLRDDAFSVRCEFRVPVIVTDTAVLPPSEEEPLRSTSSTQTRVPADDVRDDLIRFIYDEVPTDVALEVGDETFRAHRRLLAARSPVFAALFTGPMRENTAPSVRIDDMEPRVFKAMLDFMYRGNLLPPVGDDQIAMTQHLLVAADRYGLERLKSICAEKLRRHVNTSTVAATLEVAHRHGCGALRDACYDFLAPARGNLKAILKSEGFEQLIIDFPSVVVELLARVAPSPL